MTSLHSYQHIDMDKKPIDLPVGKVVCVGRNYRAHAQELNNPVPDSPLIFMKPSTSLVHWQDEIKIPQDKGECHHELELAVLIGKPLKKSTENNVAQAIKAIGLALDLTLRDKQNQLKAKGHPWELAKAFDGACPVSPWLTSFSVDDLLSIEIGLKVNHHVRQKASTQEMIWPVLHLIHTMSQDFTLMPGDVILTGTPSGVDALHNNDAIEAYLSDRVTLTSRVTYNT